jgi:hypothetical protein
MSRFVAETRDEKVKIAFGYASGFGYFYELLQKPEDPFQDCKVLKRVFSVNGISNSEMAETIERYLTPEDSNKYQATIAKIYLDIEI